jgi:hypothetical protein
MSLRWIALAILVTVSGLAAGSRGQGPGSPGETSVTPPAVKAAIAAITDATPF